jgi:hypothetical protein
MGLIHVNEGPQCSIKKVKCKQSIQNIKALKRYKASAAIKAAKKLVLETSEVNNMLITCLEQQQRADICCTDVNADHYWH